MIDSSNYVSLIKIYGSYIKSPPLLLSLNRDSTTGIIKVQLNLELASHPIYGVTKFRIRETFDTSGKLIKYRYCWEINRKPTGHITAWENEHPHGLSTDPHHHHHIPFDRKQVKENKSVRNLTDALAIVMSYIKSGKEYP